MRPQRSGKHGCVAGDHGHAVAVMSAPDGKHPGDICEIPFRRACDANGQRRCQTIERSAALGGEREYPGPGRAIGRRPRRRRLQHDVGVGAAEAEGTDHRPARLIRRPRRGCGGDAERATGEIDVTVGSLEIERRRNDRMFERQHRLEQSSGTGRRHGVADIGLDRTDGAEAGPVGEAAEGVGQRVDLDRIAEPRAGAMRLDQTDGRWIDAGTLPDLDLERGLRCRARGGDAAGATVLVDPGRQDDRADAVAVALGVLQPLQHGDADALAGNEAIGTVVEGAADTAGTRHAGIRQVGQDVIG